MKRYIHVLCALLMSTLLYTSCLSSDSDDDDLTVYDDMAIKAFSLTTVNRYIHTTSKSGGDSIYKKALVTKPSFTIDQTQYKIYNTDSLPKDCDLKHVLVSITGTTYSGAIYIKNVDSDTIQIYSSSDSIDFSQTREIRVFNNNYEKYRTYEVKINQHQVETNTILWEKMAAGTFPENEAEEHLKQAAAEAGLGDFIGTGTKEAYAFSKDRQQIMVSNDDGATWTPDSIDGDLSLLPTGDFAFASYPLVTNEDTDYQLLVGNLEGGDKYCIVWRKVAEYAEGSMPSKWVVIPTEDYNNYYLPATTGYNLVYFHGRVLAISADGIRYSRDGGITWQTSDGYALPSSDLGGFSHIKAATDAEGTLWFKDLDTEEVWRGVLVE